MVPTALPTGFEVSDDRDELGKDPFVLIVEDDPTFASILLDAAHEAGIKGVVSTAGAGTLAMARKLQPTAITLDLGLADIDGFVLLDLLKHDPETRHIPIHVISGADRSRSAMGLGALGRHRKARRARRSRRHLRSARRGGPEAETPEAQEIGWRGPGFRRAPSPSWPEPRC